VLVAVALFVLPGLSFAQKPAPPKVPAGMTAEKVLQKGIEAVGGQTAIQQVKSMVTKGTLSASGQNLSLSGGSETVVKFPNKFYILQELKVTAQGQTRNVKTEIVSDGKTGWAKDPQGTVRTLSALEQEQMAEQTRMISTVNWKERYSKAELLGIRKVGKQDAYAVRLTPKKAGKPVIQFYDTKTFLELRMDIIQDSPQGPLPIEIYFNDYRSVGGIKIAHEVRQRIATSEVVMKFTRVQINANIPDSKFAKPK